MRNSFATVALVATLVMSVGGCSLPIRDAAGLRLPGVPKPEASSSPSTMMPGTTATPQVPGYRQTQDAVSAVHRVGDVDPTDMMDTPSHDQELAQVGFFQPTARHVDPHAGCGCIGCGNAACAPPHGYVMQSPTAWNAYGIDPQEFICDGGDQHPPAIVRRDDTIGGVQLEDTIVHYTTDAGDIHVQASNRACLYAPRFASVRKITGAVAGGRAIGLAQVDRPVGTIGVDADLPGLVVSETTELAHAEVARRIDAMRERMRGVPVENILQLEQIGEVLEAMAGLSLVEVRQLRDDQRALFERLALAAVTWELDEALEVVVKDQPAPTLTRYEHVQGFTIYDFPDAGRLQISKLADRADALPGEHVNFVIRIENVGDSAVHYVTLVDNLTTRLEYVDDSQECTVDAEFSAVANEGESLKLQWKLADALEVGDSVTIRFQCLVR